MRFTGRAAPELVARYQVPANRVFGPREVDFIAPVSEMINRELYRQELF